MKESCQDGGRWRTSLMRKLNDVEERRELRRDEFFGRGNLRWSSSPLPRDLRVHPHRWTVAGEETSPLVGSMVSSKEMKPNTVRGHKGASYSSERRETGEAHGKSPAILRHPSRGREGVAAGRRRGSVGVAWGPSRPGSGSGASRRAAMAWIWRRGVARGRLGLDPTTRRAVQQ